MKKLVKNIIGDIGVGAIDYFRYPDRRKSWGGAFNGQQKRLLIYKDILKTCRPVCIVETGTYLGTTTELFANSSLPVYTSENNERNYGYSKIRFLFRKNVFLENSDSRDFLKKILSKEIKKYIADAIFFYLDAHWEEDLPLREEVETIFSNCTNAIVMIDDFCVPDDAGYGFDNYGPGKTLNLEYLKKEIHKFGISVFFPNFPSEEESGMKRGCCVLCKTESDVYKQLLNVNSLRLYTK